MDEEEVCKYAEYGQCGGAVTFAPDPFAEIYGNSTPVWECESCRYQSAMDI